MAAKKNIDWDAVEREYRAGQLSMREIAREHDVSEAAIRKRVKKDGWERDLSDEVKKRVKAKVAKQEAGDELTDDENETIEAAARRGADVVALHKTSVSTGRQLIDGMFRELLSQHTNRDLLAELVEQHCDDIGEKLTAVVQKVVSLPTRAGTARDLAQALERVVRLERQAYSLDDDGGDQAGGLADALQKARKRAQTIENE